MALRQLTAASRSFATAILVAGALIVFLAIIVIGTLYFLPETGAPETPEEEAQAQTPAQVESQGDGPPRRKAEELTETESEAAIGDDGDTSAADINDEGQVPNAGVEGDAVSVSETEEPRHYLVQAWDFIVAAIASGLNAALGFLINLLLYALIIGLLMALGWGVWWLYRWGIRNPILVLSERVEILEAECKRLHKILQKLGHDTHTLERPVNGGGISDDPVFELGLPSSEPPPRLDMLTLYRQSLRNFDLRDEFLRDLVVEGLDRVEKTESGHFRFVRSSEETPVAPLWCVDSGDNTVFVMPGTSIFDRLAYFSQDGGWRARDQFSEFYDIEEDTSFSISRFANFRQGALGEATLLNKGQLSMPVR